MVILSGWRASGISGALEKGLSGFDVDPYDDIDPFERDVESLREIDFDITSTVPILSEEYIEKEKVITNVDSEDEYLPYDQPQDDEEEN